MFEGLTSAEKDPAKSRPHRRGAPRRSWPPTRSTSPSWPARSTSTRCGRASSSRCPPSPSSTASPGERVGRSATPSTTRCVGSDAAGVVLRVGSAVRNWKPGDRVTVHCNYVDDQDPSAHDDSMLAANQRIWGFETNFGGLADLALVQGQPADAQAGPPHVGGGGGQRAVQLDAATACSWARNGARHEAGRRRAGVGRDGRHRRLRRPVRAERRRHPGRRRVVAGEGRRCSTTSASRPSSTAGPPATGSGPTSTPRTRASGAASARTSATSSARTPTSSSSTPVARPWARRSSSAKRGGTVVTCAATSGYMVEFDNRHFWMKLKRLIGSHFANYDEAWPGQPADPEGHASSRSCRPSYPLEQTGVGGAAHPPQRARGQDRRAVPRPAPKGSASTTRSCGPRIGEDKITLFRRHGG